MELRKRSVLMLSAPAVAALLMGALLAGGIPNTTDKFSEGLGATGYVVVSVVRDGQEIYHFEDHNQITETGIDFIANQVSDSPGTAAARYIGLTTTDITPDDDDTTLSGEILNATDTGLERARGTFGGYTPATNDEDDNYTITRTFTAGATHTAVQGAGLFTDSSSGGGDTLVAINEFSSVNLTSGDQLTITWTIDLGILGLDV